MDCLIVNKSKIPVPRKYIAKAFNFFEKELFKKKIIEKKNNLELTIVFLTKKEAKKLNSNFRNKNYATDVLSFENMDPDSYGELIICSQVAKKQSVEHGLSYRDELIYLTLHGYLHLLGFDHEVSKKEEKLMFDLQDSLFDKFLAQK